ncbi:MAG: neutral zinc metallopeptidase [Gammaproteobacteria bacterium]
MLWRQGRRSENIEDERGSGGRFGGMGGVPGGVKLGGGATVILLLLGLLLGKDPGQLISMIGGGGAPTSLPDATREPGAQPTDEEADMMSVVLADTEDTWGALFAAAGKRYQEPKLVLYTDLTQTGCGTGQAAAGPFYCPADQKVYIDLGFFRELTQRFGAPGDFARAYVLAHEVGHHVQNLLGTEQQVRELRSRLSEAQANALSVLVELQADCYAGVWANHAQKARQILEKGDIEEGLNAAAAVGDDRLQKMSGRGVQPESFTHGTSEQRMQWFRTGLSTGNVQACDTFKQLSKR